MKPATLPRRSAAFIVDYLLLQLVVANLGRRFAIDRSADSVWGQFRYPGFSYALHWGTFALLSAGSFIGWFLLFETATSIGSPGKALFGLRLAAADGNPRPSWLQSLARTFIRALLCSTGPLLLVYLLFIRKGLLPHDRLTGVWVARSAAIDEEVGIGLSRK